MNEAMVSGPVAEDEQHWQRLHPATLALAIVKLGPRSLNFLPALAAIGLIRQSRLSVMPVTREEFQVITKLADAEQDASS